MPYRHVEAKDVLLLPEAREEEEGGDERDEAHGVEVLGPVGPEGDGAGGADDGQHGVGKGHDSDARGFVCVRK